MSSQPGPDGSQVRASMQRRLSRPGKIENARDPRSALTRLALYLKPF